MAKITVDGIELGYEITGSGTPIVWLQGARSPRHLMRPIAEPLVAKGYQCLLYDRRNCGESDILIAGEKSEQEIWVDELAGLVRELNLGPAYFGGWSAGCRVAILTAIRYPELVKGLLLGWVTGGQEAATRLANEYYGQFIKAAKEGGMEAVTKMPFFADRIKANPGNEQRLLAMDPARFIEVMAGWERYFTEAGDLPGDRRHRGRPRRYHSTHLHRGGRRRRPPDEGCAGPPPHRARQRVPRPAHPARRVRRLPLLRRTRPRARRTNPRYLPRLPREGGGKARPRLEKHRRSGTQRLRLPLSASGEGVRGSEVRLTQHVSDR